jgi:hypothetical protein
VDDSETVWVEREYVGHGFRDNDLSRLRTERVVFDECDFRGVNLTESEHAGSAFRNCFIALKAPLAWTLCFLHSLMPHIHRGLSPLGPYMATTPTTRAYMEKNFGWEWAPSFTTMEEEWEGEGEGDNG